jgi:hypothetical protein
VRALLAFPLTALVVAAYNLLAIAPGFAPGAQIADFTMTSGATVALTLGDVLVLGGLVALFFEVLKSARPRGGTVVDHILSVAVFVVALVEFLLVPFAATASFLIITVITLVDVVAGFSVSIFSARRDFSVGSES